MLVSTSNTFLSTNMASIKYIFYCALLCYLWTGALTHCNLITNHLSICETQHKCFGNVPRRNSFLNVYIFLLLCLFEYHRNTDSWEGFSGQAYVSICKCHHLWGYDFSVLYFSFALYFSKTPSAIVLVDF